MQKVIQVIRYQCPICETLYQDERSAQECTDRGWKPLFQPGDIVVDVRSECLMMDQYTRAGIYNNPDSKFTHEPFCAIGGVYDQKDPWIYKHGKYLHGWPGIAPYWVVTLVTSYYTLHVGMNQIERHEPIYYLATEAGCHDGGVIGGWTSGHIIFKPPAMLPPDAVVAASRKHVGTKISGLLHTA